MTKAAFKMHVKPGFAAEYKRRHDEIWPEMLELLRQAGISDYSIYLDEDTHTLFAVQQLSLNEKIADLPAHPVLRRWWGFMGDIMETNTDGSPIATPLPNVFHMD